MSIHLGRIARTRRRRPRGFSLLELLVVMAIMALVASFIGPQVVGYLARAKVQTAAQQIAGIEAALDLFMLDVGRYPTEQEGLQALVRDPGRMTSGWQGPYLRDVDVPSDPWGADYLYERSADGRGFRVTSLGADGARGGEGADADLGS